MVAGAHFFATEADEEALLDHLREPGIVRLFPWVAMTAGSPTFITRAQREGRLRVGVLSPALGTIEIVMPRTPPLDDHTKSAVFNRLNWGRMKPGAGEGIVDWNRTPALFWERGEAGENLLTPRWPRLAGRLDGFNL